jgi:hypothetical protein
MAHLTLGESATGATRTTHALLTAGADRPGGVDWHMVNSVTGALLAIVTIWQIIRMERRRK